MAKGTADWQARTNKASETAEVLRTAPRLGQLYEQITSGTLTGMATATLASATGEGELSGGYLRITTSYAPGTLGVIITLDNTITTIITLADMNTYNVYNADAFVCYLTKFDTSGGEYTVAFRRGDTFRSGLEIKLAQGVEAAQADYYARILYTMR